METGTLTPRSNDIVDEMRFTGAFSQPDGFGSVLTVGINKAGDACLSLAWRYNDNKEMSWSVMLTSEQRNVLGQMLAKYQPRLYERTV